MFEKLLTGITYLAGLILLLIPLTVMGWLYTHFEMPFWTCFIIAGIVMLHPIPLMWLGDYLSNKED